MTYGRMDVLSQYLRPSPRETPQASILACAERELPCVQAIASFEEAETRRDHKVEGKEDVLIALWKDSLDAKAPMILAVREQAAARIR